MKIKFFQSNLILIILLLVLIVGFTFPLVFKSNSYIAGFSSTDESYGALWNFWWLKYTFQNHLPETTNSVIAAPFGIDSAQSGYPLWNFINRWLNILTNNIFTYNFESLFSFFASAIFMYFLVFYLLSNRICGVFSAVIYAFCPYHFARTWQHLGLAQIQWIPFYIYALFKLKEKADFKHIILAAVALFLIFSFDLYYAYFMLIVSALFVIFLLCAGWRKKSKNISYLKNDIKTIGMIFVFLTLVFLLLSPVFYQIFKNGQKYPPKFVSAHNPYRRPLEDLFEQSARPLSYFLPAAVHPVFGKFTEGFIGTELYGDSLTEHTLYLGWTPLVLAFVAFRRWQRSRKSRTTNHEPRITDKESFYIGFFVFLAFAAWLFSQPPWWDIFGFKLYMPSFFMYKILPMFRAYCRFGIVVMLAVAVLAGFGLKFILEKFKTQRTKIAMTGLFCGLVLFEFWNWPPYKVIDLSKVPAVYYWLKEHPQVEVIAEYPLDADSPNELFKFFQTVHEKKIINGTIPGTYANKVAQTIRRLSEYDAARALKWMGVKYVIVHKQGYLDTGLVEEKEEMDKISQNKGLKFVKSFPPQECPRPDIMCVQKTGPVDVYEVVAESREPLVKERILNLDN